MNNDVILLINQAVKNIINNTGSAEKMQELVSKHDKKIHFIPKKYRVFGGLLQSMNIQFGNFIEELMELIIKNDGKYEIMERYSGKKSNSFMLSVENDNLIDTYISKCQYDADMDLEVEFPALLNNIIENSKSDKGNLKSFKHDIDLLFKDKNTGRIFYLEIKYNDDHDTGKFVDINRKFIKTYAYLVRELKISNINDLTPILFFFTNKRMKGNIYIPEATNIKRGDGFFREFLEIDYREVDNYMMNLSESSENIAEFNDLYDRVMKL